MDKIIENAIELTLIMHSLSDEEIIQLDKGDSFDEWKDEIIKLAKEFETSAAYKTIDNNYIEVIEKWGRAKLIEFYYDNY